MKVEDIQFDKTYHWTNFETHTQESSTEVIRRHVTKSGLFYFHEKKVAVPKLEGYTPYDELDDYIIFFKDMNIYLKQRTILMIEIYQCHTHKTTGNKL